MKRFLSLLLIAILSIVSGISFASGGSYYGYDDFDPGQTIQIELPKGLRIINEHFARDGDEVFSIDGEKREWVALKDVDHSTFRVIKGRFAKDANNYYNRTIVLPDVDKQSFLVVNGEHGYAADDNQVYGPHGVIKDANPETFQMLGKFYSLDIANVYFDGKKLKKADAGSFEGLDAAYAKDEKNVYFLGEIIKKADPKSFEVIGAGQAKDKDHFYFEGRRATEGEQEDMENGETPTPTDSDDKKDTDKSEPETPTDSDDKKDTDTSGDMDETEESKGILGKLMDKLLSGQETSKIHGLYVLFLVASLVILMIAVYSFFAMRNENKISLTQATMTVIGTMALSAIVFWLFNLIAPMEGAYSGVVVFYIIVAIILFLMGLRLFASWIKNILITILAVVIHVALLLLILYVLREVIDVPSFLATLNNALILVDIVLIIGGTVLFTILYKHVVDTPYVKSLVKSAISAVAAGVIVILLQNIGMTSILWSVIIFHIFVGIFLFLFGFRGAKSVLVYLAQILRIMVFSLVIMLLVIYLAGWVISI